MLKAALVFCAGLLVVVPILWLGIVALSPSYNGCIQNNGQHPTEQYTSDGQQIVEGPIHNPTRFRLALVCGSNFANRNGEAFTGLFTIALTIATFILGLLAWDQGSTSRSQMRAYVALIPNSVSNFLTYRVTVGGVTRNYGNSPARDIWTEFDMAAFPTDRPRELAYPHPTQKYSVTFGTFPSAEHTSWFSKDLAVNDVTSIMQGTHRLHFWGVTHYRDVFGINRSTEFQAFSDDAFPECMALYTAGLPNDGFQWIWGEGHHRST